MTVRLPSPYSQTTTVGDLRRYLDELVRDLEPILSKIQSAPAPGSGSGTSDHGLLIGLGDDDHTQYHNNARGDARYPLLSHTHTSSNITDLNESIDDRVSNLLVAGSNIVLSYNDPSNTLTISSTGGGGGSSNSYFPSGW